MATRTTRKSTTAKTVTVIARYFLNRNHHICYSFRPSKEEEQPYCTTVVNGKATGCTCPARANFKKHVVCKHMAHAEMLEQARTSHVELIAKEGDKSYGEAVSEAYEQLATTKKVTGPTSYPHAYGTCGHLVKPGREHDECGTCYQRLYA